MFKIDTTNAVSERPTPAALGTPGYFAHGDPATGVPFTVLSSDWGNAVQDEILNVIAAGNVAWSKTDNSQLLKAIQNLARIKVTSQLTMYVNGTTGSDSNNGLAAGSAFKTIQKAANVITFNYDLVGQTAVINVADGIYTAGASVSGVNFSGGTMHFVGNITTPANCKISMAPVVLGGVLQSSDCFYAGENAIITVSGFAIESSANGTGLTDFAAATVGLGASNGGIMYFDHMAFGHCAYAHLAVFNGGYIGTPAQNTPYSIYGNARCHMICGSSSGIIAPGNAVVNISTANLNFSTAFAYADSAALLYSPGMSFNGFNSSVTGTKYFAANGGYIATGGGYTNFPGTAGSGTNNYPGQYSGYVA